MQDAIAQPRDLRRFMLAHTKFPETERSNRPEEKNTAQITVTAPFPSALVVIRDNCLSRQGGGWQQNHVTMATLAKVVMSLSKSVMSPKQFLWFLLPPAPNIGRRQPQTRGCAALFPFFSPRVAATCP